MTDIEKTDDMMKALKIIEKTPDLRAIFMQQLLHSSYEIENHFKKLPVVIDEIVKEKIHTSINELKEQITLIRDAINTLPSDLDSQVASMLNVVQASHDTTMSDIDLLQEKVKIANSMALNTIGEAMLNSTSIFEKNLLEAKSRVFDTAISELHNVTENYAKEHDAISKKLSVENSSTTRQMAWVIIGSTVVINLFSVSVMFFIR